MLSQTKHDSTIAMMIYLFILHFFVISTAAYGTLTGGRPNAFSGGQNAFAGVVNPANAVWIADRFDIGGFWVHQKSSLTNHNNNPLFLPGKTDLTYRCKNLFAADAAVHKQFKTGICEKVYDNSISLAIYTLPSTTKIGTKRPNPIAGTTPIKVFDSIQAMSFVYSLKLNDSHSVGFTLDYFYFSHQRNGYQHADNPLRSVSPGNVTNNGMDHSTGFGCSLGYRWNISKSLAFGIAWSRKSYCGQFRKYRGYEPHFAENYTPQLVGGGFTYRLTPKLGGRIEVLWSQLGNLPKANNSILPDGNLNLNRRGSKKSPGPGLQDAYYLNLGMGYQINKMVSLGAGLSHRFKHSKPKYIISHSYRLQTVYDILSFGANIKHEKHDLFFSVSHGLKNKESGNMPPALGGGKFSGQKQNTTVSMSWGYMY